LDCIDSLQAHNDDVNQFCVASQPYLSWITDSRQYMDAIYGCD